MAFWDMVKGWLGFGAQAMVLPEWQSRWSDFLASKVVFYRTLGESDKRLFERRVLMFLATTPVEAGDVEVTDEDRLLVAASAVIPVWGFPNWHYFNLKTVYLLNNAFNEELKFGQPDSVITGMVGTGKMAGKLVLSRPHLYLGFENTRDKRNVGIHEFVHLVDMADGECDGYPERLKEHIYAAPWFELVRTKIDQIESGDSNIRDYGAYDRAEFFAVASEYFFERPVMMKKKHPELYAQLESFYRQNVSHIEQDWLAKRRARSA